MRKTWLSLFSALALTFSSSLSAAIASDGDSTEKPQPIALEEIVLEDDPMLARMDSLMALHIFRPSTESDHFEKMHRDSALYDSVIYTNPQISDSLYAARMEGLDKLTPINLVYNPTVRSYIDLYTVRRREQLSRMMGLAKYYFPLFEQTLDQYNLPLELKYLAVVESALNPGARSHMGATGLWQFMYSTGKIQGLQVSSYVDERSDPVKSTHAAAQYLERLYEIFGDWELVLAAYNSGPGNVRKAIRRSGGKRDYWSLRPFLPRETAGYVPAFIAVNYAMNFAEAHNIFPIELKPSFFEMDTVSIQKQINFAQLETLLDISAEELAFLNPSYRHGVIPETTGAPYRLVLPSKQAGLFVSHEDSLYALAAMDRKANDDEEENPQQQNQNRITHHVKRGEVLGTIAESYGVGVSSLRRWNGIRGNTIRVGQGLIVYPQKMPHTAAAKKPAQSSSSAGTTSSSGNEIRYRVSRGESFYSIARKYPGISAENIMDWNNYQSARHLKPGAQLKIYPQS